MDKHQFHPSILREYDIRGVMGKTLGEADARAIGRAFASLMRREGGKTLALGFDGRLSSPTLADAVREGALSAGVDVILVGRGPTPMLYFSVHHLEADGGIMITGSHNPPDYNGFKFMLGRNPFYGDKIQALGRIAAEGSYETGQGQTHKAEVRADYVRRLGEGLQLKGAKTLAWDPGNGAASEILSALVEKLPGTHHLINATIDGTFPAHHPDPTVPENLVQLQAIVKEKRCEMGIGFDGDGDRIGLVDEDGVIVWGDQILLLLAHPVLKALPGSPIIADVKSSQVFFDGIAALGGRAIMAKTGHSLIKAKMKETGAPLAGEMSAHIFFADRYYGFDDALYAALRVWEALDEMGVSLKAFRESLPFAVNTPELRFPCAEEHKFGVVEEVKRRLLAEGTDPNTLDGVRVTRPGGWWLLRASNTQDVLVARCEAESLTRLEELKKEVAGYLTASGVQAAIA